ncbi:site-specific integrase [Halomonas elongata]|uniref:Integrase family protein n=1 Tax=Halomonas elongata (strain ATCC 33173 / DSM 2581 / NBRC 15536 / NCIMB 2198 / 1H9) TaxID=768066 RepID=E1V7Y5_HALED|nr:site-specific integrase [Halomonas elongata]WBF18787.1 site-specific integrase [Halomonas elongata]WPU47643.1 site-specific integrase [Halomonas elongata DSM 2581]CBV41548.1 integrase family protein [Halomonas elongata DSM 2581]
MAKQTEKLTTRVLERLARELPEGDEVWDSDQAGYHVRAGKRGLSLRVSYYNLAGKRRVLTLGRYGVGNMTAAKARKDAGEVLGIVAQGGDPRAVLEEARAEAERQDQQTLRAYLDGPYTAYQNRLKDGAATLRRIKQDFPGWLDKPMGSLTRADVERWQADQEAVDKPRAFGTLKRNYDALCGLLAHAAERKVIPAHPLKGVKLQKPALNEEELAEQGAERRYLEPEEVEALFTGLEAYQDQRRQQRRNSRAHGKPYLSDLDGAAYVDHVKPWILTMYFTGFRPGDLFGLRWEHVNLTFATIRKVIEKTAHKRPEPQTFPLSSAAVDVLKTWHKQQGEPKAGLVFPSPITGKRMSATAMQKPWAAVRGLGGLPEDRQLYTLRHNFASQLVMSGTDLLTVSKLMAHADIQTTIAHYAHLAPDHKRDAVEVFAQLAPGQGGETAKEEAAYVTA